MEEYYPNTLIEDTCVELEYYRILPIEIWINIQSYLYGRSHGALACTCRFFAALLMDDVCVERRIMQVLDGIAPMMVLGPARGLVRRRKRGRRPLFPLWKALSENKTGLQDAAQVEDLTIVVCGGVFNGANLQQQAAEFAFLGVCSKLVTSPLRCTADEVSFFARYLDSEKLFLVTVVAACSPTVGKRMQRVIAPDGSWWIPRLAVIFLHYPQVTSAAIVRDTSGHLRDFCPLTPQFVVRLANFPFKAEKRKGNVTQVNNDNNFEEEEEGDDEEVKNSAPFETLNERKKFRFYSTGHQGVDILDDHHHHHQLKPENASLFMLRQSKRTKVQNRADRFHSADGYGELSWDLSDVLQLMSTVTDFLVKVVYARAVTRGHSDSTSLAKARHLRRESSLFWRATHTLEAILPGLFMGIIYLFPTLVISILICAALAMGSHLRNGRIARACFVFFPLLMLLISSLGVALFLSGRNCWRLGTLRGSWETLRLSFWTETGSNWKSFFLFLKSLLTDL